MGKVTSIERTPRPSSLFLLSPILTSERSTQESDRASERSGDAKICQECGASEISRAKERDILSVRHFKSCQ